MLISSLYQSDSVIYIHIYISTYIFHILFHYGLSQYTEYNSLCYALFIYPIYTSLPLLISDSQPFPPVLLHPVESPEYLLYVCESVFVLEMC